MRDDNGMSRAQAAYDRQLPPGSDDVDCPMCEGNGCPVCDYSGGVTPAYRRELLSMSNCDRVEDDE